MRIPYVIDNRDAKLADVLNHLLGHFQSRSLDIASAYFTISGFRLIQQGLQDLGSFRLLLGADPLWAGHPHPAPPSEISLCEVSHWPV